MSLPKGKLPDISKIAIFLEAQPKRIFTVAELDSLLKDHRRSTQWPLATRVPDVIKALLKRAKLQLHQLDFPSKKQRRFTWGEMPIHQILLSLNSTKAYFSHLTALHLHKLSNKNPKTIYVNCEQSPKNKNDEPLEQSAIDEAFARPARTTHNVIRFKGYTTCLSSVRHVS
jgi:predicted transcriptional regulator of viral defense system